MPEQPPAPQPHRQLCRVGDFVMASTVPDWQTDRRIQRFTPPNQVSGGLSGPGVAPSQEWTFRRCFYIEKPCTAVKIWRREE